ncbi:hypothetical protein D9619_012043 [Psilocybe cf. subviscida]|uniref:Uncharacterized protein n=1 Tax=Psilocybe cf. subviscida TaxID=2480587 RepID=A0A8H5B717_9AGAR|nr:hypothetical protein D9619_012043 [Psilocybe cf. subviscida]
MSESPPPSPMKIMQAQLLLKKLSKAKKKTTKSAAKSKPAPKEKEATEDFEGYTLVVVEGYPEDMLLQSISWHMGISCPQVVYGIVDLAPVRHSTLFQQDFLVSYAPGVKLWTLAGPSSSKPGCLSFEVDGNAT